MLKAFNRLGSPERAALANDLLALGEGSNLSRTGGFVVQGEYLEVIVTT